MCLVSGVLLFGGWFGVVGGEVVSGMCVVIVMVMVGVGGLGLSKGGVVLVWRVDFGFVGVFFVFFYSSVGC